MWGGELKSGFKFSSVNADNAYKFYDVVNNLETIDESQSNDFQYKERILAAYILFSRMLGEKITLEAGLRGEYTFSDGLLYTINGKGNEQNEKNILIFFRPLI